MNREEPIEVIYNIITLYKNFTEMLRNSDIEKGIIGNFDKSNKEGYFVTDKYSNEYNFYNRKQFDTILNLSKSITNIKNVTRSIENMDIQFLYIFLCNYIISEADNLLSSLGLHAIFEYLTGTNIYSVDRYNVTIY
jgi:hypothetical protein